MRAQFTHGEPAELSLDLLFDVYELGLDVSLLTGDQEAEMSAQGVLAGTPDAEGLVADLGGGSLRGATCGSTTQRFPPPLRAIARASAR